MKKTNALLGMVLAGSVAGGACMQRHEGPPGKTATPPQSDVALPAAWDALCPAQGMSAPHTMQAPAGVQFEPSGAAVWGGRIAVPGDKQAVMWWWTPGAPAVVRDAAWEFSKLPAPTPDSCCPETPGAWATGVKGKRTAETCLDHGAKPGSAVPWLKAEGATSNSHGLYLTGNMGFGCQDNSNVLRFPSTGGAPERVPGAGREDLLKALGAVDLRVEGVAVTSSGSHFLVAVRQKDMGAGDVLSHTVVVVPTGAAAFAVEVEVPAGGALANVSMGLSDITVLQDGRVALTISREDDVDGRRVVGGALLVTEASKPWETPGAWKTSRVAEFEDHKPEGVVQLSASCAAVIYDDDERFKAQSRASGGAEGWASHEAFVRYVRF